MNKDNKLALNEGGYGLVLSLAEKETVFVPTRKAIANARILDLSLEERIISVHWRDNYNLEGDFRTELMIFDLETLVMDKRDLRRRNKIRKEAGLVLISAKQD